MGRYNRGIPWPLIFILLVAAMPIGIFLLVIKLFENGTNQTGNAHNTAIPPYRGQRPTYGYRSNPSAETQGRTYQPAKGGEYQAAPDQTPPAPAEKTPYTGFPFDSGISFDAPPVPRKGSTAPLTPRQKRKLFKPQGGFLRFVGAGMLLLAALTSAVMIVDGISWYSYYSFIDAISNAIIATMTMGLPGAAGLLYGNHLRGRSLRCRQYYTMIGGRRTVDIRELAAAIPVSYGKACKDLQWMISEGYFPGAYIDASRRCLTYANAPVEPTYRNVPQPPPVSRPVKEEKPQPQPQPQPQSPSKKQGVFEEVEKIRRLNDSISDAFVSDRVCHLEELTQKILTYVQDNPKREERIRQFKDHYLPKTMKILESYARFEKQGVSGANIRSAMKDVEEIMDTLVSGFEKQLDMLFDDEALDVSTDINVLESMMGLQGLHSDDPFQLGLLHDEL